MALARIRIQRQAAGRFALCHPDTTVGNAIRDDLRRDH